MKITARIKNKNFDEINEFVKSKKEIKNISQLIRVSINDFITKTKRPLSKEIEKINHLIEQLRRIGINLNQLVIVFKIKETNEKTIKELQTTLKQIKLLIKEASLHLKRFNDDK